MLHGMDNILTGFHLTFIQQRIQNRISDQIHSLFTGMDSIRQKVCCYTAHAQVGISNAIMLADGGHDGITLSQLFIGVIGGRVSRQQHNKLGIRVVKPNTKNGMQETICQIVPLSGGQIHVYRCGFRIKCADLRHMGQVIGATIDHNDIRCAVAAQILNAVKIAQGRILAGIAGGNRHCATEGSAAPAVIDTQFGIQTVDDLHPPGFIHVCQQVILRIPR